ncbi:MAG: WbuC family cupin fold metalloprotein [Leptospiraceae bacterium]|nr:WbuC family cupin fold metalloprotein [Leptospiraceae bacterium]
MTEKKIQIIAPTLLDELTQRAIGSARQRTNHNFHQTYDENPNRFLNVMVKGTYVTPHRHTTPPKSESFVVLRGQLLFLTFDDQGGLQSATRLGAHGYHRDSAQQATSCRTGADDNYGIDIAPGIWHSIIVESETAVCFEVKPGPYAPASDKDFAPWAPREGASECLKYAADLYALALQHLGGSAAFQSEK